MEKRGKAYTTILRVIRSGQYSEGELLPKEDELAAAYGYSRSTVNRALQRLKDEGYLTRKPGFGTIVRSGSTASAIRIGLLVPGLNNTEIFEPICKSVAEQSTRLGYSLYWNQQDFTADGTDHARLADSVCANCIDEGIQGLLFAPASRVPDMEDLNHRILAELSKHGVKVVLLDRDITRWPGRSSVDLVGLDNFQAGYTVANHLIERGARSIIFLVHRFMAEPAWVRLHGAKVAVMAAGNNCDPIRLVELSSDHGDIVQHVRQTDGLPDAIICGNDTLAARVYQSCVGNRVAVPQDLLLAGFDDVIYARHLGVPLTSYRQPCDAIATSALEQLKARLRGSLLPAVHVALQGSLSVRTSTTR